MGGSFKSSFFGFGFRTASGLCLKDSKLLGAGSSRVYVPKSRRLLGISLALAISLILMLLPMSMSSSCQSIFGVEGLRVIEELYPGSSRVSGLSQPEEWDTLAQTTVACTTAETLTEKCHDAYMYSNLSAPEFLSVCMCIHTHVHMYTCMHSCMYAFVYMYTHIYVLIYLFIFVCIHISHP